ncbi:hypothetical protein ACFL6C_07810, partial [Myxococcota bacterium]
IVSWKIRDNGSVGEPRLVGPPTVLGTSLPACFASVMQKWRFPVGSPTTIRNFPLGSVTVPKKRP